MLEKASDDADHADAVANSAHSGPEAADSARDQVDSYARAGSVIKALDYLRIDERIHLGDDSRLLPRFRVFRFAPDHVAESLSHVARRDKEIRVAFLGRDPSQHVEQISQICADGLIAREQAEVGINARGFRAAPPR